ncbi:hypothetical protein ACN6KK_03790 [Enterococcus faecium]
MAKVFEAIIRLSFFASYPQRNGYNLLCIEFFGKANYDKIYLALKKLAEKISHVFKKIQSKKAAVNRMETKMARHQSVSPCFLLYTLDMEQVTIKMIISRY